MHLRNIFTTALLFSAALTTAAQTAVAHFDLKLNDGNISETVSNISYPVISQLPACTVEGIDGDALRFDGYSNYVKAGLPTASLSDEALTIMVTLAAETYPMMKVDVAEDVPTFGTICGNLDEDGKKGFAFELSSQGDLQFRFGSASGFMMKVSGDTKLPRGQWCQLAVTLDKANNVATLYLNGNQIGTGKMGRAALAHSDKAFMIGKAADDVKAGLFLINTFCGAIDDIAIYNEVSSIAPFSPLTANLNYPASRYAGSLWRPQFHGMPSGSWTNETHGMVFSDGKYHLFFQKNANGPYMSRLHWGHLSSADLCNWTEEPIAVAPGEVYDLKGCWSGCVYEDGGNTNLLYTAVDNAKATIAQAQAKDAQLIGWEKQGVVINGKPQGLSDDFRDPYFFTVNGQKYIIVGTSKNNIGACTLHRFENGSWSNDGTIFFQGGNANQHGRFWEMPTVTDMGGGKWLFTCTPLGTGVGVRTLCWVGTIGTDGKFTPEGEVQYLEMNGVSRDGFGLLSPTICQHDGKTLLLGIVPDKLATEENKKMGWAHNYSLPREVSIAANGQLVQQPYAGLSVMRSDSQQASFEFQQTSFTQSLAPVSGRQLELLATFTVAPGTMGFRFLKLGSSEASLTFDADLGTLTLDLTKLERTVNDQGVYNGVYIVNLPETMAVGETLKLNVFLDGSILDIFVNDRWAYSVRLFPTNAEQVEVEAFSTAATTASVKAWVLDATKGGVSSLRSVSAVTEAPSANAYDLSGIRLQGERRRGVYIAGGKKYVAR
ncbi:MAG: GH32 C-terminal domain-containing protein [Prevotella sp.]|nr:GH32 C-terminal domain-containing protein [Prevotella sp.]